MIGRNVKIIRKSKGMSVKELAEKSGYQSESAIIAIENGRTPSFEKTKDIANALGVSIAQLKGTNNPEDENNVNGILLPIANKMTESQLENWLYMGITILLADEKNPQWEEYKRRK